MIDTVEIELNGTTRHIRFNFNAAALAEQEMSRFWGQRTTIDTIVEELSHRTVSFANLRAMLWAGLRHEDAALTVDAVGDMLTPDNMPVAFGKVWEAVNLHLYGKKIDPFPKGAKEKSKRKEEKNNAGSGLSPAST